VKYIPTESVTLYVAATAAINSLTEAFPSLTAVQLYCGFVVLTPISFSSSVSGNGEARNCPLFLGSPRSGRGGN
jgi:hypothetical protein